MVSDYGAWVTSGVSAKPAQRAQFTISTQGIVTHSQAQGSEAGAQPKKNHERASKAAWDLKPPACKVLRGTEL